ncbi:hypothetical protein ACHFJ0_04950 [Paracoccus sp. NGMCC 1.201697]|uniref:Uncharacterized protein n=1 Tax=Paracoccus broussonetiae subsp. drimophilus TaxID=3373869 RepID=A0ABW7LIN6_9RHOB
MNAYEVHYYAKGHMGQYETWWYLLENDDGSFSLLHEWDSVTVGTLAHTKGKEELSLEDGFSKAPEKARVEIARFLAERGHPVPE